MQQNNIVKEIKNIILQRDTIKNVITVYKVMNPQHTKVVNDILTMIEDQLKGIEESVSNIAELYSWWRALQEIKWRGRLTLVYISAIRIIISPVWNRPDGISIFAILSPCPIISLFYQFLNPKNL